ncbi:hypothetical protein ASPFODRAFT_106143, partial [Aspergillus luchuensis CBS 106.47]
LQKSRECCRERDTDVPMIKRLKHNGQIMFLNAHRQWPLSREQRTSHYSGPQAIAWNDLAAKCFG